MWPVTAQLLFRKMHNGKLNNTDEHAVVSQDNMLFGRKAWRQNSLQGTIMYRREKGLAWT